MDCIKLLHPLKLLINILESKVQPFMEPVPLNVFIFRTG